MYELLIGDCDGCEYEDNLDAHESCFDCARNPDNYDLSDNYEPKDSDNNEY